MRRRGGRESYFPYFLAQKPQRCIAAAAADEEEEDDDNGGREKWFDEKFRRGSAAAAALPPLWPAAAADSKKGGGREGEKRTRKKAAAISQKKAQKVAGCNIFCWYVNWQNPISIPFSRQILTYYRHYNYVFFLQKRQFFVCTKKVLHRYLCLCVEVRGADE